MDLCFAVGLWDNESYKFIIFTVFTSVFDTIPVLTGHNTLLKLKCVRTINLCLLQFEECYYC